jgi:hypothetical protein
VDHIIIPLSLEVLIEGDVEDQCEVRGEHQHGRVEGEFAPDAECDYDTCGEDVCADVPNQS